MEFLKLGSMEFIDSIRESEIGEADMIKYIKVNSNNDIEYLGKLRDDAQKLNDYYDTIYKENLYDKAYEKIKSELEEGLDVSVEYEKGLASEDLPRFLDELRAIEGFEEKNPDEKRKLKEKLKEKYLLENRRCSIVPIIRNAYNWDTHGVKIFIRLINNEIDKLKDGEKDDDAHSFEGSYKIAKSKKTDFIKIISAMYDLRMFETSDGRIADNKENLLKAFGSIFDEDFSTYATLLSRAKSNSANFLDIFDSLKQKGEAYYYDEKKK